MKHAANDSQLKRGIACLYLLRSKPPKEVVMGLGMHLRMLALSDVAQEPVPGLQLAGPISARVLSVFVFKYLTRH